MSYCGRHDRDYPDENAMCSECADEAMEERRQSSSGKSDYPEPSDHSGDSGPTPPDDYGWDGDW
jgi:hypothetical protein